MAKITFSVSASPLIRGQFRRALKAYCHIRGYTLSLDEDRGLLMSMFNGTITLPEKDLELAEEELNEWFEKIKS